MAALANLNDYRPTTLADRGMLVKIKRKGIAHIKRNQDFLERVAASEGLPSKKLSAGIRIFTDAPEIQAWEAKARELAEAWKVPTYRWLDDGTRFAVTEDPTWFQSYMANLRQLRDACDRLRMPIEANWEQIIADDIQSSSYKLDRSDYPSELGDRCTVEIITLPVPHEDDFRTAVSEGEKAALRSMLHDAQRSATVDLVKRMMTPLKDLAEKLAKYDPANKGRWSTSVVDNLVSQADLIIDLNRRFENDVDVEKLARAAKQIVAPLQNPETAKADPEAREKTKERLDKLATIMGGFGGADED